MACKLAHTLVKVADDANWTCPKCGAGFEDGKGLVIDEPAKGCECDEFVHEDDEIACFKCGSSWSGRAFALQKSMLPMGSISIGRTVSNKQDDYIKMEIRDAEGKRVLIEMDAASFALAVTGKSATPCKVEYRPPVGKKS